ncbi:MAG: sigma-70 family RNA polymerase sigma factor [Pirellulaceae bacterium]
MGTNSVDKSPFGDASSISAFQSGSIRELGRYRSFLRLQALGLISRFQSKLEPSDIVQQTLLDAHQNLDQFRGTSGAEMAKWLSQMLANNVADAARALTRQKRDVRREQSLQRNGDSSRIGAQQWIVAEQTTPSLCVARCEQMQQLSDAIRQLPTPQQEVVVLHHLQGRSLNETAEMVGRSPSAVAGLLFRGLKSLRSLLAGQ